MDTPSTLQQNLSEQRISLLEGRMARVERALNHLLGEPMPAAPVEQPAVQPEVPELKRFLLNTQSIRPDFANFANFAEPAAAGTLESVPAASAPAQPEAAAPESAPIVPFESAAPQAEPAVSVSFEPQTVPEPAAPGPAAPAPFESAPALPEPAAPTSFEPEVTQPQAVSPASSGPGATPSEAAAPVSFEPEAPLPEAAAPAPASAPAEPDPLRFDADDFAPSDPEAPPLDAAAPRTAASGIAEIPAPPPLENVDFDVGAGVEVPAKPETAAPSASVGFRLSLTAAFKTLDDSIDAAAGDEMAHRFGKGSGAPVIEINPELVNTARMRLRDRKLAVRSPLEEFHPSLLRQITAVWGLDEAPASLRRLLIQDSGGRMGLDPGAKGDVVLLCAVLEERKRIDQAPSGVMRRGR